VNAQSDSQLLRGYAERRSEAAFAELVRRHIDLVHSAAVRMVNDPHLAKDVAQGVFVALAKDAGKLTDHPVLSGWLHLTTRNLAAQTIRTEVRRRNREKEAAVINEHPETDASWEEIAPHLDAALAELSESDRDAVLLRYFENKPAQEMAAILGISTEAAQKRVSRGVEKLRENFAKRGLTAGAAGLASAISVNAVQAAPAGLAAVVSGTVATSTASAAMVTKLFVMPAIQKALVVAAIALLGGVAIHQTRQASQLRQEVRDLRQQRDQPLTKNLRPDQTPARNSTRPATVVKPDFSVVIRDSASLSSSERSRKLQDAATAMADAEFSDIQQALLQLPAGTDSFGAFNSLVFYMCQKDCPGALALFAEWVADESFPVQWLYSAAENGLANFGEDHPLEAIQAAQDASAIHSWPLGKFKLIQASISRVDASQYPQVSRELLKLNDQNVNYALGSEATLRVLIGAGDLDQAIARVKAGNDPLAETSKAMIGRKIAESAGFGEGLTLLGAADRGDPGILSGYYGKWIQLDPNRTLERLPGLEAHIQDRVIEENIEFLATWAKSSARGWAERIRDPALRASALRKLGQ
jgi:RNA polymerase sigma factor (sigma-70 family)